MYAYRWVPYLVSMLASSSTRGRARRTKEGATFEAIEKDTYPTDSEIDARITHYPASFSSINFTRLRVAVREAQAPHSTVFAHRTTSRRCH